MDTTPVSVKICNVNPITCCAGPIPVKWRPVATDWKCYILLQMPFKCTQILKVACHSLKESQYTETVDCFTILVFNSASNVARSKSNSCGKMPPQQVLLTAGGLNVNVLIKWSAFKWKLSVETVQSAFLMQWNAVKLSIFTQVITVSPRKGSGTSFAALARVLWVSKWHVCFMVSYREQMSNKIKFDGYQQCLCL